MSHRQVISHLPTARQVAAAADIAMRISAAEKALGCSLAPINQFPLSDHQRALFEAVVQASAAFERLLKRSV